METILGHRECEVTHENGNVEKVSVRQLPLRDYEKALAASDNEFKFVSVVIDKPEEFVMGLHPESFDALVIAAQEVNEKGFFAYSQRQQKKLAERMNSVRPEVLKLVVTQLAGKALPTSAPGLLPRAG